MKPNCNRSFKPKLVELKKPIFRARDLHGQHQPNLVKRIALAVFAAALMAMTIGAQSKKYGFNRRLADDGTEENRPKRSSSEKPNETAHLYGKIL
jgi:hypothetical protein